MLCSLINNFNSLRLYPLFSPFTFQATKLILQELEDLCYLAQPLSYCALFADIELYLCETSGSVDVARVSSYKPTRFIRWSPYNFVHFSFSFCEHVPWFNDPACWVFWITFWFCITNSWFLTMNCYIYLPVGFSVPRPSTCLLYSGFSWWCFADPMPLVCHICLTLIFFSYGGCACGLCLFPFLKICPTCKHVVQNSGSQSYSIF